MLVRRNDEKYISLSSMAQIVETFPRGQQENLLSIRVNKMAWCAAWNT